MRKLWGFSKEKKLSSSGVKYLCLYTKCRYSVAFDDVFPNPTLTRLGYKNVVSLKLKTKQMKKLLFEY
ncbi:MAG: hypothetical protein U9N34_08100 [Candidatus Cloacimonadota bacterium]|nr:hypothetical protein [Candidatus Cloacimonadota bacterium]